MCTFPLGPQIQALNHSAQGANDMSYRDRKIKEILKDFEVIDPTEAVYDDIFCGEDLRKLSQELNLTSDDTTVIISLDGAQLYQNKKSDTWIAIWIVTDYSPKTRYRSSVSSLQWSHPVQINVKSWILVYIVAYTTYLPFFLQHQMHPLAVWSK
jgi:hypothetical protein